MGSLMQTDGGMSEPTQEQEAECMTAACGILVIGPGAREHVKLQMLTLIQQRDALKAIDEEWRRTFWVSHGHAGLIYGDDGEMQCNVLPNRCDFKRDPISRVVLHVVEALKAELASSERVILELTTERNAAEAGVRQLQRELDVERVMAGQALDRVAQVERERDEIKAELEEKNEQIRRLSK